MIGQFYDAKPEDIPSLMKHPVLAAELQKWPLKHGTYRAFDEKLEDIRRSGLRADGGNPDERNPHSSGYDRALGRTDYVFLAPADFRFSYGFGSGFLIDPDILSTEGVICADQDIDSAFQCLKIVVDGDGENYVGRAKEHQALIRMAQKLSINEAETVEDRVFRILRSDEFLSHYRLHYQDSVATLLSKIEAYSRGESLFEFFNRTGLGIDAEILVPKRIAPEFILGHWNGVSFTKWNDSKQPETRLRLETWISTLQKLRDRAAMAAPK